MDIEEKIVSELEFGQHMLIYRSKEKYPLEYISFLSGEDLEGEIFLPSLIDYNGHVKYGLDEIYRSREEALAAVGRCWDKAEKEFERMLAESVKQHESYT